MLNGLELRLGRLTIGDWRKLTDELRDLHMQRASQAAKALPAAAAQAVLTQAANEARSMTLGSASLDAALNTADGVMTVLVACMRKVDARVDRLQVEQLYYQSDLEEIAAIIGRVNFPNARPTPAAPEKSTDAA